MKPAARPFLLALLVAAAAGPGVGCSVKKLTVKTTAQLLKDGSRAMEAEPDLEVARSAVPGQLKTIEGLLVASPRDRLLLTMAARACLEFSFGFLEDDVEELRGEARRAASARASAMYDRALAYALRLLATWDPEIRAAFAAGGPAWEAEVARLPPEAVAGLTFGGMALASAVALNRFDPGRLADLPKARVLLERAHAVDSRFYFGGAAMALGSMRAQLGDREGARRDFDEALRLAGPDYLLVRVMRAKLLLTAPDERRARIRELEAVLAVPRERPPRLRLVNEVARRRAARYLSESEGKGGASRRSR